jgi:hypothetical protein
VALATTVLAWHGFGRLAAAAASRAGARDAAVHAADATHRGFLQRQAEGVHDGRLRRLGLGMRGRRLVRTVLRLLTGAADLLHGAVDPLDPLQGLRAGIAVGMPAGREPSPGRLHLGVAGFRRQAKFSVGVVDLQMRSLCCSATLWLGCRGLLQQEVSRPDPVVWDRSRNRS